MRVINKSLPYDPAGYRPASGLPARGGKPSKKPLYAEALRLYMFEGLELPECAQRLGLRLEDLVHKADCAQWLTRRASMRASQAQVDSVDRESAQKHTDRVLVTKSAQHIESYLVGYASLGERVLGMPLEPDPSVIDPREVSRERVYLMSRKADLMGRVSKGIHELASIACDLGLVKLETGQRDKGDRPDLSRLTQLNITLNALRADAEKAAPLQVQPLELDDGSDLI